MRERTRPEQYVRSTQPGVGNDDSGDCTASDLRDLLLPYAFGGCVDQQEDAFEAHVLECDRCYEDLCSIERTRSLIENFVLSEPPLLVRSRTRRRRHRTLFTVVAALALAAAVLGGYLLGVSA